MLKDYVKYFFGGTSNIASSKSLTDDFELNAQYKLSKNQEDFVLSSERVERNVNLFFAILGNILFILGFIFVFNQIIPNAQEDTSSMIMLSSISFIFIEIIIMIGIFFKLVRPYLKQRVLMIYKVDGIVKKKILDFDSTLMYQIEIDKNKFFVDKNLYDSIGEGKVYGIHFVKTPRQNLILSMK